MSNFKEYLESIEKYPDGIAMGFVLSYSISESEMKEFVQIIRRKNISFLGFNFDVTRITIEALGVLLEVLNKPYFNVGHNLFRIDLSIAGLLCKETESQVENKINYLMTELPENCFINFSLHSVFSIDFDVIRIFKKTFQIMGSTKRRIQLHFSHNVSLGTMGLPALEVLLGELLNNKNIESLNMCNCQLDKIEPEFLEKFLLSLIQKPSLKDLWLGNNNFWRLEPTTLQAIAAVLENREKHRAFLLYDASESNFKTEIETWDRERQKVFLETRVVFEQNNLNPKQIMTTLLVEEDIFQIFSSFLDKNFEKLGSGCEETYINSWELPVRVKAQLTTKVLFLQLQRSQPSASLALNISGIRNDMTAMLLKDEIKKRKQSMLDGTLEIKLDAQSEEEINYLVAYINKLDLPKYCGLTLSDLSGTTTRMAALLRAINNKGFNRDLNLKFPQGLGNIEPGELDGFINVLKNNEIFSRINLSAVSLDAIGEERVIKYIETLKQSKKIMFVDISQNNLEKFGVDFLLKLSGLSSFQNKRFYLALFNCTTDELPKCLMTLERGCQARFDLVRAHILAHHLMDTDDGPMAIVSNVDNVLSNDEHYRIIKELISRLYDNQGRPSSAIYFIKCLNLEPKNKVELMRKLLALDPSTAMGGLLDVFTGESNISVEDRVALFLEMSQIEPFVFYSIDYFDVYQGEQPVHRILSSMQRIDNKELTASANDSDEDVNIDDEDIDFFVERILKDCIPNLEKSCREVLPQLPFVSICLRSIESHKNDDSMFPLLRMIAWLVWSCAKLATMPELNNILLTEQARELENGEKVEEQTQKKRVKEAKQPRNYVSTFNDVMKQILDFANPKMRYDLTASFFNVVCLEPSRTYFSLVSQCSVDALLPAIPLCEIVLQETDEVLRKQHVALIVGSEHESGLLNLCANSQFQGRFYRNLVAGLCIISADQMLTSSEKFGIIQKIIAKSKERKQVEERLDGFITACENKEKESGNVDLDFENIISFIKDISPVLLEKMNFQDCRKSIESARAVKKESLQKIEKLKSEVLAFLDRCKMMSDKDAEAMGLGYVLELEKRELGLVKRFFGGFFEGGKRAKARLRSLDKMELVEVLNKILETIGLEIPKIIKRFNSSYRKLQRHLMNVVVIYYNEPEFKQKVSNFIMVQGLGSIRRLSELSKVGKEDFNESAKRVLQGLFGLTGDQREFYEETFAKCHNETALLTYYSKILALRNKNADRLMALFKRIVQTVLSHNSADFYEMRYDKTLNPQLGKVFGNNLTLETQWQQEVEMDFVPFIRDNNIAYREFNPNFRNFLKKKIQHRHLDPQYCGDLQHYLLTQHEEERSARKISIENARAELLKQTTEGTQSVKNKIDMLTLGQKYILIQFQLLRLLETPIPVIGSPREKYDAHIEILQKVRKLVTMLPYTYNNQFMHDIDALINGLMGNRNPPKTASDFTGWKIVKTGHYWRTFMSGTDVEGSCQNVTGDPSLNQCLLGYVANGYIMMLAILKPDGEIYARCMAKLLFDEKNQSQGIFLEEIYPDTLRPDLRDALITFAILQAKTLKVQLGSLQTLPLLDEPEEQQDLDQEDVIWESIGGQAPIEYVDALFDTMEDGIYQITLSAEQVFYHPETEFSERLTSVQIALQANDQNQEADIARTSPVIFSALTDEVPGSKKEDLELQLAIENSFSTLNGIS